MKVYLYITIDRCYILLQHPSHPPKSDVNEPSIDFDLDIKVKVNSVNSCCMPRKQKQRAIWKAKLSKFCA